MLELQTFRLFKSKYLRPSLQNWNGEQTEKKQRQTLLLLATPKHAAWLETHSIQALLDKLMLPVSHQNASELDVICACVDGLAPSIAELSSKIEHNREGISILLGTTTVDSTDLLYGASAPAVTSDQKCSLQFHINHDDNVLPYCQITTPLANTIFTNGRRSTLLISRWQKKGGNLAIVKRPSHRLKASINLSISRSESFFDIPVSPLTFPRKIQSGLGNIVRRLIIEGSSVVPASQELEKAVIETNKTPNKNHDNNVWAMIMPPGMTRQEDKTEHDYSHIKELIVRGAKLYRVLSGGGGWGNKEGLLALDPETSFEGQHFAGINLPNNNTKYPEKYTDALTNIAQEGASIQFYRAISRKPSGITQHRCTTENQIVIGSISSTVDEIVSASDPGTAFIAGHFGCVSESGIFFQSAENLPTKIDVPHSYFYGQRSNATI
ncbi:V-type ATPase, C subunit family protein [Blumeria hordei DH14]|uniref:V-type ATPase, C subunit family protein n=1 Tax=Blumeria graminis f. sp. hordei (strain DH14) TaxID=546991 RepID=N1JG91_BLUG1|nr:V-type ATPase, C subunit family protein [Blumeria hordei DH14]